jgi:cyclohexadieny/prephenate dehydrogenase
LKLAIVGFGLIGSSLARALRRAGPIAIQAIDTNPANRAHSAASSLADAQASDIKDIWPDADMICLATPVAAIIADLPRLADRAAPHTVIFDVGSVKGPIAEAMTQARPDFTRFVPAHPMAGAHLSGPGAGSADLFQDRHVILTPTPKTDPNATKAVGDLFARCGAKIAEMSPEHHDEVVAYVSHVPHLLAFAAMLTGETLAPSLQGDQFAFASSGFASFTRIAASDPTIWVDILLQNREKIDATLALFTQQADALRATMMAGDADTLKARLTLARELRKAMESDR